MKFFRLKSMKSKVFNTLLEMKEFLGLSETDTLFNYCRRTGDVIQMKDTSTILRSRFHTFYDVEKEIGL